MRVECSSRIHRVAHSQQESLFPVAKLQLPFQNVEKLEPWVHVRLGLHLLGQRHKLGKVWVICRSGTM